MPRMNGPKIRALMKKRGIKTKKHLQELSGIGSMHTINDALGRMNVLDSSAEKIADALDVPVGDILLEWLVSEYDVILRVSPLSPPQSRQAVVGYVKQRATSVVTDNVAQITKRVSFVAGSRTDPFVLQYRTRSGGLLKLLHGSPVRDPNKNKFLRTGEGREIGTFFDYGNSVTYEFDPEIPEFLWARDRTAAAQVSDRYVLDLEVLKGFDQGHCDLTCYLPELTSYAKINVTLDVRSYLHAKYTWRSKPHLRFFENNQKHVAEYKQPENRRPEEGKSVKERDDKADGRNGKAEGRNDKADGLWEWSLSNRRPGVLYLRWDLDPPD